MSDSDPEVGGLWPCQHEGSPLKSAQGWEDATDLIDRVVDTDLPCFKNGLS